MSTPTVPEMAARLFTNHISTQPMRPEQVEAAAGICFDLAEAFDRVRRKREMDEQVRMLGTFSNSPHRPDAQAVREAAEGQQPAPFAPSTPPPETEGQEGLR